MISRVLATVSKSGWVKNSIRPSKNGETGRKCSGNSVVKLGRKMLNTCQPLVEEDKIYVEHDSTFGGRASARRRRVENRRKASTSHKKRISKNEGRVPWHLFHGAIRNVALNGAKNWEMRGQEEWKMAQVL